MRHIDNTKMVEHDGVFHQEINQFEAIALIVSGTVGAGVLAIPYAVSKVGLVPGLVYIIILGLVMMGLNLLIGELSASNGERIQLAGLAKKYLGEVGGWLLTGIIYTSMFGSLLVYGIGVGHSLTALFGGTSFAWSVGFFCIMAAPIILGMRTVKVIEFFLTIAIFAIVMLLVAFSVPHVQLAHMGYFNVSALFFPYGIILYAFSGASAIPETHSILAGKDSEFKKAIMYSSFIIITLYCLFALMTVGVLGTDTTEIATIGLGQKLGPIVRMVGNIFAILSMGTCFLMSGLALRDSFAWDFKIARSNANMLVLGIPLIIFLLGLRQFITALDFIGGVLISTELFLIILMYWRAKQTGDMKKSKYRLHHSLLLVCIVVLAFSAGALYSIFKLF